MRTADSALDHEALAYARALLKAPLTRERPWRTVAAAAAAAASALLFAYAMIVAPPVTQSHLVIDEAPAATGVEAE